MKRKRDIATLRKVAEIRRLQQLAAEAQVFRANAKVGEEEAALGRANEALSAAAVGWRSSVEAFSLPLELSTLWASQAAQNTVSVRMAAEAVDAAATTRARFVRELRKISRSREVADGFLANALRANRSLREEKALQQAEDLHLQRRARQ